MENQDFLETLRKTFFEEADEILNKNEVTLLEMEDNRSYSDCLDIVFRQVHTLKGSAKSVDFRDFYELAHVMENLIADLIANTQCISKNVIDLLLKTNDVLVSMIHQLKDDTNARFQLGDIKNEIVNMQENLLHTMTSPLEVNDSSEVDTPDHVTYISEHESEIESENTNSIQQLTTMDPNTKSNPDSQREEYIRLPIRKLDSLLNTFGEQVILQSILEHCKDDLTQNADLIKKTINQLSKITYDLQHSTMALRMVSVKGLFNKVQRLVRDTSNSLNKDVKLTLNGENTEIDKSLSDELSNAITHIIRNAIDHGIETAEERIAANKSETGNIIIDAYQNNGFFFLEIKDDGRGLNKTKIIEVALKKGIVKQQQTLTAQEINNLIFKPGFTTVTNVTDYSGRGVGMDAVRNVVLEAKGSIVVESQEGLGTTFLLKLPLSMTIFNGTIVRTESERFIVPNADIREVFQFNNHQVRDMNNKQKVVIKGDKTIALYNFDEAIGRKTNKANLSTRKTALLIRKQDKDIALEVDEILGQQRIVLKKIGNEVKNLPGVAGGAILADGRVALVLNINAIAC